MRVLLDTNVLISAVLFRGVPRRLLDAALKGEIELITSFALLQELEEVLIDRFEFTPRIAAATRAELESIADVVDPVDVPRVCRDPDDDQVLAAAVDAEAKVIVSGDKDLLALNEHRSIAILSPAQFERGLARGEG